MSYLSILSLSSKSPVQIYPQKIEVIYNKIDFVNKIFFPANQRTLDTGEDMEKRVPPTLLVGM